MPLVAFLAGRMRPLPQTGFIVLAMGLKPSPSGETFRFFCSPGPVGIDGHGELQIMAYIRGQEGAELDDGGGNFRVTPS